MYYFIVNYTGGSGRSRATWNKVYALLKKKNIEYKAYVTKYEGHASQLAKKISLLDDDDIRMIVVGGDGTINEVLNGIADFSRVKFAIIPTGSGNDFARGLGLPGKTEDILDMILSSKEAKKIDVGEIITENGDRRYFGISAGIGLDAIVCKKTDASKLKKILNKVGLGSLSYVILTIITLFSMETYDVRVDMKKGDGIYDEKAFNKLIFLAAMNTKWEGGGVPMNPNAQYDDGFLSICAVSGIPKLLSFFNFPVLIKGKHEGKKGFLLENVEKLTFDADRPMVLHTDGEYIGDIKHFEMKIHKNVLNVML